MFWHSLQGEWFAPTVHALLVPLSAWCTDLALFLACYLVQPA